MMKIVSEKLWLLPLAFIALPSASFSSIIITTEIHQTNVTTIKPTFEKKFKATGFVEVTDPAGNKTRKDMPPDGGKISVSGPGGGLGNAIASASVDPNTGRKSSGSIYLSESGWTARAMTDAHPYFVPGMPIVEITTVRVEVQVIKAGPEHISVYISPDVQGEVLWDLKLVEMKTGTILFASHSVLNNLSPDIVSDDTGHISWTRIPGVYQGLSGVDDSLVTPPTIFSNNRWFMALDPQSFDFDIELKPGDLLEDYEFALFASHQLATTSGTGYIGVGDIDYLPEPKTWTMLIAGLGLVGGILRRHQRVVRDHALPAEVMF